ncbi:hypothetical protein GDO81_012043 [Engystomops pustulosus]|uniref:Uncharacterized protein n=1 Tax=Engystomops pustulosus TaxID=76066 RepID=A0AAV7BIV3_ENGPU|nr:hypothetical protein GDO81_012043 [Engystomops pustulosus]
MLYISLFHNIGFIFTESRRFFLNMSTEFVSPLDHSEDILDNLSEQLMRNCDIHIKGKKGKNAPTSQNIEMDLNRPRRKDTPALHKPPFIPDFSELLLKRFDEVEKQQKNMQIPSAMNKDPELSKPRRKDAPALHATVLLPGTISMNSHRTDIIINL